MLFLPHALASQDFLNRHLPGPENVSHSKNAITPSLIGSALTFMDFAPRLECLTLVRDFLSIFGRAWKCVKWTISLFCESFLVLFLTFIIGTPILCCTTTNLGIFEQILLCATLVKMAVKRTGLATASTISEHFVTDEPEHFTASYLRGYRLPVANDAS